jgi:hypothetical protein
MKLTTSTVEPRKNKTAFPSKKNSQVNSLIYKEIDEQMQKMFTNNKTNLINHKEKELKDNKSKKEDEKIIIKKGSFNNIKKKPSNTNISNH